MDFLPLNKWIPQHSRPLVIAGPCSAESLEQMLSTAKKLSENGNVQVFRAGIWKPRTRPGSFEGVGEKALEWLKEVKNQYGFLTTTEVASAKHVEAALKQDVDILWIGARTTVSPFSIQEIADALSGVNIPVMVKNPVSPDLSLWIGALERFHKVGVKKLAAIHRGFSNFEKTHYRNCPMWKIPIELKNRLPELPLICDPSHIAGKRDLIFRVCQKAMDVEMDGLMVETHIDPSVAKSDAAQQVTPDNLKEIIDSLSLRSEFSVHKDSEKIIESLREKIDRLDHELMENLSMRMNIVKEIAEAKKLANMTPLQMHRMGDLMDKRIKKGESMGLESHYIKELFDTIHEESVRVQTNLMNTFKTPSEKDEN